MKLALLSCKNARHNCAGAADCLRMFLCRTGEFCIYPADDTVAAVVQCDYCINGEESFDRHLKAWNNDKNTIPHIHLAACTSICPCDNYPAIRQYFLNHGITVGEFKESDSN